MEPGGGENGQSIEGVAEGQLAPDAPGDGRVAITASLHAPRNRCDVAISPALHAPERQSGPRRCRCGVARSTWACLGLDAQQCTPSGARIAPHPRRARCDRRRRRACNRRTRCERPKYAYPHSPAGPQCGATTRNCLIHAQTSGTPHHHGRTRPGERRGWCAECARQYPPLRERREWSAGCLEKERSTFRQGRSPVCSLATRNTRGSWRASPM